MLKSNGLIQFVLLMAFTSNLWASIAPIGFTPKARPQMVNLNLQIQAKQVIQKSNLVMPYYQTAEFERKVGDKNVLIELNPKHGKNSDEVAILLKFYRANQKKAFYKKEVIAKMNEESKISLRGMSFKIKPVLN